MTMRRPEDERAKDEQIERPLEQLDTRRRLGRHCVVNLQNIVQTVY
jgi:hypothetical protein